MSLMFPITALLPTGVSGNGIFAAPVFGEIYVSEVAYYLRALTTGPHTVQVRDPIAGTIISTHTFNASGVIRYSALDVFIPMGNGIAIDVPTLGTGAGLCTVTIWCYMP